jgi:cytochrome b6-f complex iron-sulfur subunit
MSDGAGCEGCAGRAGAAPVGRREFLGAGVLGAAALLLAACSGSATGSGGSGGTPSALSVKVSDYSALSTTGGIAVLQASNGYPLAVVRTASGYVVLSRVCPHQGSTVNVSGSGFLCPNHGARFSATGAWTGGERTSGLSQIASSYDAATGILAIG